MIYIFVGENDKKFNRMLCICLKNHGYKAVLQ